MAHGNNKKPPAASTTKTTTKTAKTQTTTKTPTGGHKSVVPPPKEVPKASPREKQIIWEDDNDFDFEDVTFVVPIVISVIILGVFFLRKYIRWNVECQSNNRIDGKTVVITGKFLLNSFVTMVTTISTKEGMFSGHSFQ